MKHHYKVVTLCASLTPYAEMAGQVVELEEDLAAQFPSYLQLIPKIKAPEAPPAEKMVESAPAKKDVKRGNALRPHSPGQAVPRA